MSRLVLPCLLLTGCGALVYLSPAEIDPQDPASTRRQAPHAEIHRVYRMARRIGYQDVSAAELTTLKGGGQAQTVLLQRTRWTLRFPGQSTDGDLRRRAEYLRLPEKERLQHMERTDDFVQLWWIEAEDAPARGAAVARRLEVTERPHSLHREAVYLGADGRVGWYLYAPIHEWIPLQHAEKLRGGEDPVAAALRGLAVKDRGGATAFACFDQIMAWGARALPGVEAALARRLPQRGSAVRAVGRSDDPKVGTALARWAASSDAAVAGAARRALLESPRPEARALYQAWLSAEAGQHPVANLLGAAQAIRAPVAATVLARVMARPESVREYRLAFELKRRQSGSALSETVTGAAGLILRAGFATGGRPVDRAAVQGGVKVLLSAGDPEGAAVVALDLALYTSKGDYRAANRAGVAVLRQLPGKAGLRLVSHLARSLRGTDLVRVQKIAAVVMGLETL